ncbi:MAG: hypothetical protein MJE68_16200, partial [Proteobacteria bacterium]|nr:hypothetical protein [Pseudomonadota bacterium]
MREIKDKKDPVVMVIVNYLVCTDLKVEFLRHCKKIEIGEGEFGWQASIRSGSTLFSTPIAA